MFNPIMAARLLFETHDLNDNPCQQLSLKRRYSLLISKVVASLTFLEHKQYIFETIPMHCTVYFAYATK